MRSTLPWLCGFALLTACGGDEETAGSGGGTEDETGSGATSTSDGATRDATDPDDSDGDSDPDTSGPPPPPPPSVCGDGVMEDLEECDDGNEVSGDGCEVDCTITFDTSIWQVSAGGQAGIQDVGHGVAVDGAGNIIAVGYVSDAVANPDIWIRKLDPDGNEIWTTQLDPSGGGDDRAYAVAVDSADNIYVTGEVDTAPALSDLWVGQLSPDGNPGWSDTVDGPDGDSDGGRGIAVDANGNVFVAGFVKVGTNDNDIFVGRWNPGGAAEWSDVVAGPGGLDDRGRGIAVDALGGVVVGGFVANAAFNRDVWLRKYDADGAELWTQTWDSIEGLDDAGFSVAVSPDNTIAIAGTTPVTATNQDAWLGKFAADGTLVWFKQFGGASFLNDHALGVTSDADGAFVVAGFKSNSNTDRDIWMRKYDATGEVIWTQSIAGGGLVADEAQGIAADEAGNYIAIGEIRADNSNDGDVWIGKFAPQ